HGGIVIVAVAAPVDAALGGPAREHGLDLVVPEAVAVAVGPPPGPVVEPFVDLAVAVLVLAVADLVEPRGAPRVGVVAVAVARPHQVAVGVELARDGAVAVLVPAVAGLGGFGMDVPVAVVA